MKDETKKPMEAKEAEALKGEISAAVEACLAKGYATKDEAIDAVVADLEALKEGGPDMGGLGTVAEDGMPLPEAEEEGE